MSFPTDSRIWSASPPLLAIKVIPTIWSSGFNCGRLWICFFFITTSGPFAIRFFQQTQRTTVYLSPPSFFLLFNAFQPSHLLLPTGKYQGSLTCKQGFIRIPTPALTADFPKLLLLPLCLSPPAPPRRYLTLPLCNFLILKCRPCNQFLQDWTSSISEAMVPFLNPSPTTSTMEAPGSTKAFCPSLSNHSIAHSIFFCKPWDSHRLPHLENLANPLIPLPFHDKSFLSCSLPHSAKEFHCLHDAAASPLSPYLFPAFLFSVVLVKVMGE